jgi:VWFA-related protein
MRRPLLLSLLLASLSSQPIAAQTPFVESIEVRITNVDVAVTDRSGRPITGLTRDDFQIFENGKAQPITNFSEVRSPVSARPGSRAESQDDDEIRSVPQNTVIFIDNESLDPFSRNNVLRSVSSMLRKSARPEQRFLIAVWRRSLHVVQPFTTNVDQIVATMDGLASEGGDAATQAFRQKTVFSQIDAAQSTSRLGIENAYDQAVSMAQDYASERAHDEIALLDAMKRLLATLGGLPGKKSLLFVGQQLPEYPGREAFLYVQQAFGNYQFNTAELRRNQESMLAAQREAIRVANTNEVTLYMIDAAHDDAGGAPADERAPWPVIGYSDATNTVAAFQRLARETGGLAAFGGRTYDRALQDIEQDFSFYYSLGYKTTDVKGERKIAVRLKNRDAIVRSRSTWVGKTTDQQLADQVVTQLFHKLPAGSLHIRLESGKPVRQGPNLWRVPIVVVFPASITLLPQGDHLAGGFAIYIAASDSEGGISPVSRQQHSIRMPAAKAENTAGRVYINKIEVVLREGVNTVSVAVQDTVGGATGLARMIVLAK